MMGAMLASNANSPKFGAVTAQSSAASGSLIDGPLGYALAAAGLVLWQLGRLDHGPLGTALRGEFGIFFTGFAALGFLIVTLQFARRYQSAPHWRWAVTLIVLSVLTVGYAFGFAEQVGVASQITTSVPSVPVASKYPATVRQHFMNACITSGSTQSTCACAIDGIQAHYSLEEFVDFDKRARSGEPMPPELVRIVSTCKAR